MTTREAREEVRVPELSEAQTKAEGLFHAVETRGLIRPGITEGQLNEEIRARARAGAGRPVRLEFGGPIAGRLIGQFPHQRIAEDKVMLYVHPRSSLPMRSLDEHGQARHWMLEIHFVDRARQIGGFCEELLTVG